MPNFWRQTFSRILFRATVCIAFSILWHAPQIKISLGSTYGGIGHHRPRLNIRPWGPPSLYNGYRVFLGGKVWPECAADHSPPSSAAVMEEQRYTSTHPLGHTGPVTGSLYLFTYFPPVQTGPGAHPTSCKMGTGSFPGVKCAWGVLLTTHPLLVSLSWKSRAIPLPTLWATPACNRITVPLPFIYSTAIPLPTLWATPACNRITVPLPFIYSTPIPLPTIWATPGL